MYTVYDGFGVRGEVRPHKAASKPVERGNSPRPLKRPRLVHPLDLQAERDYRDRKKRQALARNLRQAALNATAAELHGLRAIQAAVLAGSITVQDAHKCIARCRDDQRARTAGHAA